MPPPVLSPAQRRKFNLFVNFFLFSKNLLEIPDKCGMIVSVSTRKKRVLTLILFLFENI